MNIIIIGATSGIGKALFKKYVTEGNLLGIVGRRTNLLEELRQQHPDSTFTTTADITKQIEIEKAIHELFGKLGSIDLAIVCSGTGEIDPSLDYDVERSSIDTDVCLKSPDSTFFEDLLVFRVKKLHKKFENIELDGSIRTVFKMNVKN